MYLRSAVRGAVLATIATLVVVPLSAQSAPPEMALRVDYAQDDTRSSWSALRVAKWTTGVTAAGLAVYGVVSNRRADEQFEALERACEDDPARCMELFPGGEYADAELEAQYQDVRSLDRRARASLIAGQVGIAASVVLFILDLRNSADPDNIPYEPRSLDIAPARDGGMSLRLTVPLPRL